MTRAADFVGLLLRQRGDRYLFGVESKISNPDPSAFDCSELVEWGCGRFKVRPRMPDGSWLQAQHCRRNDTLIKVSRAIDIQGALLFRFAGGNPFGKNRPDAAHVAVSLGNGSTIEARGRKFGVNCFNAVGRNWTHAALIPGLDYEKAPKKIAGTPNAWRRHITQPPVMTGDDVRTWQLKMKDRGWRIRTDGVYDKDSEQVCVQFQREKKLEIDGVIGPQTWHATWHARVTP
ncbi:peptidoglycan-binding protein [Actinoplanes sp. GCM10030250]|uniref:C40 family peptidase n=1 Tax=Actinoplanes sp. GCM10030250 TaxID=3273376 RepID=UPI00362149B5